uniref:hypothetical protein n=1 Tax=Paenibacillus camerounensis TaxID=1243663 RepID=UPI001ADF8284
RPRGVRARESAASLAIGDARLRAAVRQFVRQWEALAYGTSAPPPAPAVSADTAPPENAARTAPVALPPGPAAFISLCLKISFRLA